MTILGDKRLSDVVNIETDIIAKYVEKLLCPYGGSEAASNNSSGTYNQSFGRSCNDMGITKEFLLKNGF